jgi:hypothetical protein
MMAEIVRLHRARRRDRGHAFAVLLPFSTESANRASASSSANTLAQRGGTANATLPDRGPAPPTATLAEEGSHDRAREEARLAEPP